MVIGILRCAAERYAFDFVAALELGDCAPHRPGSRGDRHDPRFSTRTLCSGITYSSNDPTPWRIAQIAEYLQHDAGGGPRIQPVRPVGDQEVTMLRIEVTERRPAYPRLLRSDELFQRGRPVCLQAELVHQRGQTLAGRSVADQIEPRYAPALRLTLRERSDAARRQILP